MTNMHHEAQSNQRGAALLVLVVALLFCVTWIVISLAKTGQQSIKMTANDIRAEQAAEAAAAGSNFGLVYFSKNSSLIVVDANANGYIDAYSNASITNVALSNGSSFSITYSNPTVNDLTLILITSIGTMGNASREERQLVKYTSLMSTYSANGMTAKGNISMSGNSQVTNTANNQSLASGGTVTLSGGASTVTSTGTSSTSGSIQSDVSQNNVAFSSATAEAFFVQFFGSSSASVKAAANYYYTNASNTNYNATLHGKTSTAIWIDQTGGTRATIDSNTVIGSLTNPVLLVVNGDLTIQGNAQIFGYIYVTGNLQTAGNSAIRGAIVAAGNMVDSGNFSLIYNTSVLAKVQQLVGQYGTVPNSWNDLKK